MWLMSLVALWIALLLVLFVPADLSLELERRPTFHVRVGFRWLLFRVRRDLAPTRSRFKNQPRRLRLGPIPLRTLIAVGKVPGLWASARRFARRLARSVRVLQIRGRVRLGTGDPADTGRLWALVGPATLCCNRPTWIDVALEPDFSKVCLTGTVEGTFRLYPARLAYSLGSLIFSVVTMRLVLAVMRSRPWKH